MFAITAQVVVVAAAVVSLTAAAKEGAATLTGTVVDPALLPLPGTKMALLSQTVIERRYMTETDKRGTFRFVGLAQDSYYLTIQKLGFFLRTEAVAMSDGEQRIIDPVILQIVPPPCGEFPVSHAINLRIMPGERAGQILSRVVLDYKHTPGKNANISLVCNDGETCRRTRADPDGWFELADLPPGRYSIKVEYPGFYNVLQRDVEVVAGLELLYSETYLQPCPKGNCDPRRRPKPRRTQLCL